MKLKTTEGEKLDTYQCFAKATKASMYEEPHDTLSWNPIEEALASAIYETCTKMGCLHRHILKTASKPLQES